MSELTLEALACRLQWSILSKLIILMILLVGSIHVYQEDNCSSISRQWVKLNFPECSSSFSSTCAEWTTSTASLLSVLSGFIFVLSLLGVLINCPSLVVVCRRECSTDLLSAWMLFNYIVFCLSILSLFLAPLAVFILFEVENMRDYVKHFNPSKPMLI